jgi:osmotically-inducible protein OsmY
MLKPIHLVKYLLCFALLTGSLGCAANQTHESTGEYLDDSVITTKVKAVILEEPSLKVFQIGVKSNKGVVQLSGFVDSALSVNKAAEVTGRVAGVSEVKNDLIVK